MQLYTERDILQMYWMQNLYMNNVYSAGELLLSLALFIILSNRKNYAFGKEMI